MSIQSNKGPESSELDNLSTLKHHSKAQTGINNKYNAGGLLKCNCCIKTFNEDYSELGGHYEFVCRWRFCCKWFCGIATILVLLIVIIVFAAYLPSVAQTSMDDASLIQIYFSMLNPTNNSIQLNSTMQIVNSGAYDATMDQTVATLLYKNEKIGTFIQPQINIKGGLGATFQLLTTINIPTKYGRDIFQSLSASLLNGSDVTVTFKSKPKLHPKIMGITLPSVSVNMNKDLTIQGALMQNPEIRNITNFVAPPGIVNCTTEIEFWITSTLHVFGGKVHIDVYDINNNQLGVATIYKMQLIPGYNKLTPIKTHLFYCSYCSNTSSWNNDSVDNFGNNWAGGINQILNMRGPTDNLVISNAINQNAFVYGYGMAP